MFYINRERGTRLIFGYKWLHSTEYFWMPFFFFFFNGLSNTTAIKANAAGR